MSEPRRSLPGTRHRAGAMLIAVLFAALAAGCGSLTAGGHNGTATMTVSGDAEDPQGTSSSTALVPASTVDSDSGTSGSTRADVLPGGLDGARPAQNQPRGDVDATFRAYLVAADGSRVPLSDGEISVRVDIPGESEAEAASRVVPARDYFRVRLVFTDIRANVTGGLVLDGLPVLDQLIRVEPGADSIVVEKQVSVEIPEDGEAEILVDLNSAAWLRQTNPALMVVAGNVFRSVVRIRVR